MAKKKTMCGWKKSDLERDFKEYRGIVSNPQYACMKCGRVADKKKRLCKPVAL